MSDVDYSGGWDTLPRDEYGRPIITINRPSQQLPSAVQPIQTNAPIAKDGQIVQQPDIQSDILTMPGKVAGAIPALLGGPEAKIAAKEVPVFYSAVEHAVNGAKIDTAPVSQWLGYLKNQPGVKQEELDWTLGELAKDQKFTKSQMQDYVAQNKVQLGEVNKGNRDENLDDVANDIYGSDFDDLTVEQRGEILNNTSNNNSTKYSQYQLPGGTNYREKILTLPDNTGGAASRMSEIEKQLQNPGDYDTEELNSLRQEYKQLSTKVNNSGAYQSSHWDEPNVLAHVRMNDRVISDDAFTVQNKQSGNRGPLFNTQEQAQAYQDSLPKNLNTQIVPAQQPLKTLHLEEIQSDWHQAGRQTGYKLTPQQEQQFQALDDKIVNSGDEDVMGDPDIKSAIGKAVDKKILTPQEGQQYLSSYKGADAQNPVPNAPFKQTWPDLVLKRMIREAADNGYDAISWTPGGLQRTNPKNLGTIGTAEAERADAGLKQFYDTNLVNKANAIAKKYGGQVEVKNIDYGGNPYGNKYGWEKGDDGKYYMTTPDGRTGQSFATRQEAQHQMKTLMQDKTQAPIHFLRLPQSLKDVAQSRGFPLFSAGGAMLAPVVGNPFADDTWYKPVDTKPEF